MKDRVPGAPGQYKAVINGAELEKLNAGEEFTITMTRDDQPITEGTPYSKAAVLPDALAAALCPGMDDPTPADALSALHGKIGENANALDAINAKNLESASNPGCFYRLAEDGSREWINPPMSGYWNGYRTTKRYDGKPVFTTRFRHSLPNNTNNFLSYSLPVTIVCYTATVGNFAIPTKYAEYVEAEGKLYTRQIDLYVSNGGCGVMTNFDASGLYADVTIEYVYN